MKWNKYTIKTTTIATDFICGMFSELGIDGVEIQDNIPLSEEDKKKMFIDILPELPPDKGVAYISFYIEDTADCEDTLSAVDRGLRELRGFVDIGEGSITTTETEDKDWINNWKKYFKPFTVDDILIKPTWETVSECDKDKLLIEIDPGTSFGTGMHETTQLCIRQLKEYINTDTNLLDAGCGSGILAIIAMKLGAKSSTLIDIDEHAVDSAIENLKVNNIDISRCTAYAGNIIGDKEIQDKVGYDCYDVIVANILADVIIPLSQVVSPHLKKGGIFISSGIINTKEEAVVKAIESVPELRIVSITHQKDWVSIAAVKE